MTLAQLILYLMIGSPEERAVWKARAKAFCERHLIADDPYDELTTKHREEQKLTQEQKDQIKEIADRLNDE